MQFGDDPILLPGPQMVVLISAIDRLSHSKIAPFAVVGGVAVSARLGSAHRATADVDAVVEADEAADVVDVLVGMDGIERDLASDHRVLVDDTKIEVIPVRVICEADLIGVPDNDALFLAAHSWGLRTAADCTLTSSTDATVSATIPVATPTALVAMKLHAIEDRRSSGAQNKRASDALDIFRLLVEFDSSGGIGASLRTVTSTFRLLVSDAARRILVENVERTRGWMRLGGGSGSVVTAEELRFVGERLVSALA